MPIVYKYSLRLTSGVQQVKMNKGAKIVLVGEQKGEPTIWALCDPKLPKVTRSLRVRGTGEPVTEAEVHVGSFQSFPFVWHVFEEPKR